MTKAEKKGKALPWHLEDCSNALFCVPNNEEFKKRPPLVAPYVFMQPVDDRAAGHDLVASILKYQVATLLHAHRHSFDGLLSRLSLLQAEFGRLKADVVRWAWPRIATDDHLMRTKEEQNCVVYALTNDDASVSSRLWHSFVRNLASDRCLSTRRLPVLRSLPDKAEVIGGTLPVLPRIPASIIRRENQKTHPFCPSHLSEATWRELILGEGGSLWQKTVESQRKPQLEDRCYSPSFVPIY